MTVPTHGLVEGIDAALEPAGGTGRVSGRVTNVRSDVMRNIWRLFHENNIEFPFPQRDVLIKPDSAIAVKLEKEGGE